MHVRAEGFFIVCKTRKPPVSAARRRVIRRHSVIYFFFFVLIQKQSFETRAAALRSFDERQIHPSTRLLLAVIPATVSGIMLISDPQKVLGMTKRLKNQSNPQIFFTSSFLIFLDAIFGMPVELRILSLLC
jgi:hypothetical protein